MGTSFRNPRTQRREWELWEQKVQEVVSEEDLVEVPAFIALLSQPHVQGGDEHDHVQPMLPVTRETREDHPPASAARPEASAAEAKPHRLVIRVIQTLDTGNSQNRHFWTHGGVATPVGSEGGGGWNGHCSGSEGVHHRQQVGRGRLWKCVPGSGKAATGRGGSRSQRGHFSSESASLYFGGEVGGVNR
eukprot:996600-Amphidinium_carterae.1